MQMEAHQQGFLESTVANKTKHDTGGRASVRLPKLEIPKFDGKPLKW